MTVTTPGGTSNPAAFAYVSAPTLTGLNPGSGPTAPRAVITLSGTALSTASTVQVGTAAAGFTVVSDAQITVAVPA
ncbi:IPT/TIG domain-containing protein [Streptomyces sp. NPDC002685]|uniref:IPT/TIG domain-containing protein n=1 Tax=Streptomyces sp. NPDC002685 TaxID=3154540 RepID=UPI003320B6F4